MVQLEVAKEPEKVYQGRKTENVALEEVQYPDKLTTGQGHSQGYHNCITESSCQPH